MRVLLPKTLYETDPSYGPVFFLAGPVRGGDDWQADACREIQKHIPHFYAALPCRYPEHHPLMRFCTGGKENHFDRQLSWERHYLTLSSENGCLLFWLPAESKKNPREGNEPYAMDTRGELGEWRGRLMHNPGLRIVVGAEEGFPGLSQIQRNFNFAMNSDFPIYPTLAETVAAGVAKAQ